ncbi:MAG: hypothetical protein EXR35_07425 [Limnohabitans sp.]|nr:hypothetical protein [Limnohabitans sp.]
MPCTSTQWAQRNLALWKKQVTQILPKGDAQLQINQNPFSLNVVVSWEPSVSFVVTNDVNSNCKSNMQCLSLIISP